MKKLSLIFFLLILGACNNKELEQKVQDLTAKNAQQQATITDLEKQVDDGKQQVAGLEEKMAAFDQAELDQLREQVKVIPELEKKATERDEFKKRIDKLGAKVREATKEVDKIKFLKKQLKGVKATIVTDMGDIEVEFYEDLAPIHVFNFVTRAESGYYNGTQFHRVIPGFMIQGGDPNTRDENFSDDGQGAPLVAIPHEFNSRHHGRGILSMARRGDPRVGAGTQFFVMHADYPSLNNQYTVFGKVSSGMEAVDKIVRVNRNRMDHPIEPVWIREIKVYK